MSRFRFEFKCFIYNCGTRDGLAPREPFKRVTACLATEATKGALPVEV